MKSLSAGLAFAFMILAPVAGMTQSAPVAPQVVAPPPPVAPPVFAPGLMGAGVAGTTLTLVGLAAAIAVAAAVSDNSSTGSTR